MKYNVQAIELRGEILQSLSDQFTERAEELASEDKREVVTKEDMYKAILLLLVDKGVKLLQHFEKK